MKRVAMVLLSLLWLGCGSGGGAAVVATGPDGVEVFYGGGKSDVTAWSDIRGLHTGAQLNANNNKSYPVLYISTEKSPNKAIASSYDERVDKKAYAGMHVGISVSKADFDELKSTIIQAADLQQSAKSDKAWVAKKSSETKAPTEKKTYYKRIGG